MLLASCHNLCVRAFVAMLICVQFALFVSHSLHTLPPPPPPPHTQTELRALHALLPHDARADADATGATHVSGKAAAAAAATQAERDVGGDLAALERKIRACVANVAAALQ